MNRLRKIVREQLIQVVENFNTDTEQNDAHEDCIDIVSHISTTLEDPGITKEKKLHRIRALISMYYMGL